MHASVADGSEESRGNIQLIRGSQRNGRIAQKNDNRTDDESRSPAKPVGQRGEGHVSDHYAKHEHTLGQRHKPVVVADELELLGD